MIATFREFVETIPEHEPKFNKLSDDQISKRGNLSHTLETDRFHVKAIDHNDGFRTYTVHDKATGEHVGTVEGQMLHKGKTFRAEEVTKDRSSHPQMMHEVYDAILNNGTSMMSSGSISKKAHKIWERLHSEDRPVRLVKDGNIVRNSSPDWKKNVQKSTLKNIENPTVYFVKAK